MTSLIQHTQDHLLDGKITLRQPQQGYRVAIDPVFLAAAVHASSSETILDVGAGVGAASLCLAHRLPECRITGLELQRDSMRLASQNIELNNMRDRVDVLCGDLSNPPPRLVAGTFHHVMTNPPYFEEGKSRLSPSLNKHLANTESSVNLSTWIKFCLLMLRPKGSLTLIHKADRLYDILNALQGKVGDVTIFPLWPAFGKPAKRVIIKGAKNNGAPLKINAGMILHNSDGSYTKDAEEILRGRGISLF